MGKKESWHPFTIETRKALNRWENITVKWKRKKRWWWRQADEKSVENVELVLIVCILLWLMASKLLYFTHDDVCVWFGACMEKKHWRNIIFGSRNNSRARYWDVSNFLASVFFIRLFISKTKQCQVFANGIGLAVEISDKWK